MSPQFRVMQKWTPFVVCLLDDDPSVLPQMSGLEVQSQLRKISPSTRVIVFTGNDDPLVRSTALNTGASAFLTKPFDDAELLASVRLALASAA
jgi:DNA-binding response OmpR family regulator